MRTLAVLTIPCAVVIAIALAAVRVAGDSQPPRVAQRATAIVWGGRVFVNRNDLARWLRSRGATYTVWSDRHPSRPVAGTQPTKPKSAPAQGSGGGLLASSLLLAAGGVAAGLGVAALLYRRLRRRDLSRPAVPRLGIGGTLPRLPSLDVERLAAAVQSPFRDAWQATRYQLGRGGAAVARFSTGRRVPRLPAINVGGLVAAMQPPLRGAWEATRSQLGRRRTAVARFGTGRRVPRLPAVTMEGFLDAIEPAVRGSLRTTHYVLRRRSEVAWVVATSGLAIAVALLLPRL